MESDIVSAMNGIHDTAELLHGFDFAIDYICTLIIPFECVEIAVVHGRDDELRSLIAIISARVTLISIIILWNRFSQNREYPRTNRGHGHDRLARI